MIREGSDPVVVQSSIALLQERFKQLQKLKEMRQERQLLKLLVPAEDKPFGPPTPSQQKPFGPSTPPQRYESLSLVRSVATSVPQLSLSLWPTQSHSRCLDSPSLSKSCWLVEKEKQIEPCFFLVEQSKYKDVSHLDEVDTSLHL